MDTTGQLSPTRQPPDGLSPVAAFRWKSLSPAKEDSIHAVEHEATSRAPAGGGVAVDLITKVDEAQRGDMLKMKIEFETQIRVDQENNVRHTAQVMRDTNQDIKATAPATKGNM